MGDLVPMRPTTPDEGPRRVEPVFRGEPAPRAEPLLREVTGEVLRDRRHARGEKLSETAGRAGVSTQYLSEVERGRKDASSEVISAVAGALDLTLLELTVVVARRLSSPAGTLAPNRPTSTQRGPLALALAA